MEEDIGDIGIEHVVMNLSAEQTEALAFLYTSPDIDRRLNYIAFKFGQDKDDLKQMVALKLSKDGYALRDLNCLRAWCCITAKHICINGRRHDQMVKRRLEIYAGENVKCKRGGEPIQRSAVKTPEERMLEQEQEAVRDRLALERRARLHERLRDIICSLPKDVRNIARLWDEGNSPTEIAAIVKKSVATVYRKHKEFQKQIIKRNGIAAATTDKEIINGLELLISQILKSSSN